MLRVSPGKVRKGELWVQLYIINQMVLACLREIGAAYGVSGSGGSSAQICSS
jgi:hypothetical protein